MVKGNLFLAGNEIPTPDYDNSTHDYNDNGYLNRVEGISSDEHFLTSAEIRKIMPQELKAISKDIQMRSKQ